MAPYAHLAICKVCFTELCFTPDILAGVDAALADRQSRHNLHLTRWIYSRPFGMDGVAVATFVATLATKFLSMVLDPTVRIHGATFDSEPKKGSEFQAEQFSKLAVALDIPS